MEGVDIVKKTRSYVKLLLGERLSRNLFFHNLAHTQSVVSAVTKIGAATELKDKEMEILEVAAWFHDTGHLYHYKGHEENSVIIASTFLVQQYADDEYIHAVRECIEATRMPQNPKSLMQEVICDADLYHFAANNYFNCALLLKKEWEICLGKKYTDNEWDRLNLTVLKNHTYFTQYGQTVLQQLKEKNISALNKRIGLHDDE